MTASLPTSVKIGGSGRTGPKGGTSSLAVTDTWEGKHSAVVDVYVSIHLLNLYKNTALEKTKLFDSSQALQSLPWIQARGRPYTTLLQTWDGLKPF